MTTRLTTWFTADTADEAMAMAREWARAEPKLRLRTIASCRLISPPDLPRRWEVVVVVNEL